MTDAIVATGPQDLTTADPGILLDYLANIDRAICNTYEITDALQLKDQAESIRFLSRKIGLDKDIQNRASASCIRSQARLGELLQAMTKASPTGSNQYEDRLQSATDPPTYNDLGIEKTAAHRWQTIAKIPEAKRETFIREALEAGHELTTGGMYAYARNVLKLGPLMSSQSAEWYTTPDILAAVIEVMGGIDLDPCSNSQDYPNVPAAKHYTVHEDGLSQEWHGRVYMNPPYGNDIIHWMDKLNREYLEGRTSEAIVLAPARPDTAWFRILRDHPRCFMNGRVRFNDNPNSAPFPTMLVSVGCNLGRFVSVMARFGDTYERRR